MSLMHMKYPSGTLVQKVLLCSSLWLLLEVLLLLSVKNYPFPWFGLIDSWLYSSMQWNPSEVIAQFRDTYYATRIPAFAHGILIHRVFGAAEAAIFYKLALSAGMCAGWAALCYRLAGLPGALLSIAVGILAPWMLVVRSTEYIDNAVLCYASLSLAFTTLACDQRSRIRWSIAAGFCLMSTVVTNVATVLIYGPAYLAFCALMLPKQAAELVKFVLGVLIGGLVASAVFGAVSLYFGGHFFILGIQLRAFENLPLAEKNPWSSKNWLWLYQAGWLLMPLAALVWGSFTLSAARQRSQELLGLYTAHIVMCLSFFVIEFTGTPVLFMPYYGILLFLTTIPLLTTCALFSPGQTILRSLAYVALVAAIIAIGAWIDAFAPTGFVAEYYWLIAVCGLIAIILAIVLGPTPRLFAIVQQLVLWITILFSWSLFTDAQSPSYGNPKNASSAPNSSRDNYVITKMASDAIINRFPQLDFRVWIDKNSEQVGNNVASSLFYAYRLFSFASHPARDETTEASGSVVLVADQGNGAKRFTSGVARDPGLRLTEPDIVPIRLPDAEGVDLVFFKIAQVKTSIDNSDIVPPQQ